MGHVVENWGRRCPGLLRDGVPVPRWWWLLGSPLLGHAEGTPAPSLKAFCLLPGPGSAGLLFPCFYSFSPVTRSLGTLCLNRALSSADSCGAG